MIYIHPHEEARRAAWVEFIKHQALRSGVEWAAQGADQMLREYDKRFPSPYQNDPRGQEV